MLKNIKIAPRLILIGSLLIVIPLVIVGGFAINRASSGLITATNSEISSRSLEIAKLVNTILSEQLRFVTTQSIMPVTVKAAEAAAQKGVKDSQAELGELSAYLEKILATGNLGKNIQVLGLTDNNGTVLAASAKKFLGVNVRERRYFQNARAGKPNIGEANLNKVTGKPFLSFAAPVRSKDGTVIGTVIYIYDIGFLNDLIVDEKIGKTGYAFIIDQTGLTISHPDPKHIMKTNLGKLKGMEKFVQLMRDGKAGVSHYVFEGNPKTAGYAPIRATGWSVGLTMPDDEYMATVNNLTIIILVVGIAAVVIAVIVFFLFAYSLARNLKKGVLFASRIAAGELDATIDIDQKDEIGELAESLREMAASLRAAILDINTVLGAFKQGDLSREITAELPGDLAQLKIGINGAIDMLSELIVRVISSSEQVDTGSTELSRSAQSLAAGTTEQAASLEEIASSMNEVDAKTRANNDNAIQSQQLISDTQKVLDEGNQQMLMLLESINKMKETSENVTKIIKDIDEIAFQTNLLALNAAVEAARAGKYGKGFAVVAEEVRSLAARSAEAARNTAELITGSVRETETSVLNAEKTSETLNEINTSIQKVNDIIEEIAMSSREQTSGIAEINTGLTQVNTVIQNNSSISEETASASDELSAQSRGMAKLISIFKLRDSFLHGSPGPVSDMQQEPPQVSDRPRIEY